VGLRGFAVLAAVLLVSGAASAQERHRISGEVTDTEGNPLPGTTIRISGSSLSTQVLSDDAGRFEMRELAAGTYAVEASLAGFRKDTQSVQLGSRRRTASIRFKLRVGVLIEALFVVDEPRVALRKARAIALVRLEGIAPLESCTETTVISYLHHATVLDIWRGQVPRKIQISEPNRGSCVDGDRVVTALSGTVSSYPAGTDYVVLLTGSGKGNQYGTLGPAGYAFSVHDGIVTTGGFADLPDRMAVADFRQRLLQLAR
jgi:hypothetical protein